MGLGGNFHIMGDTGSRQPCRLWWSSVPWTCRWRQAVFFHCEEDYTTIPSGFIKIQPAPPTKDARYQIFFGLEHFLFFHILGKIIPTD